MENFYSLNYFFSGIRLGSMNVEIRGLTFAKTGYGSLGGSRFLSGYGFLIITD